MKGKALRGNTVTYGEFGLQALEPSWITSNQIEAARRAMTRYVKRGGNVWIKIFPHKSVTQKPAETRMGSGKGSPDYWVAVVKPGRIMFEMGGVSEEDAREAMRLAANKAELFNLRFQLATGQLDNPLKVSSVRKDIARVKTIIRERELGIGKEV